MSTTRENWIWPTLRDAGQLSRTRRRRRSKLARPYICRLIILMRLTCPSTAPELWARVRPVADGVVVGFNAADEGVQFGLVVDLDRRDPRVEVLAVAFGEHLGEGCDVDGEPIQIGTGLPNVLQGRGFAVVEGVGVAQDEVGDLAAPRWPGDRRAQWPAGA